MGKGSKRRTATTIIIMLVIGAVILFGYFYWINRTDPINTSDNLTEAQQLINKDFISHYPETPKEVAKVFANMTKVIYSNPTEEDLQPLAIKIRELYDDEFLQANPEDIYLNNLYVDLASWKEKNRSITNYLLIREGDDELEEIDGRKYATKYISYTIQEDIKFTETWKVMLRQDNNKRWKILGWKYIADE